MELLKPIFVKRWVAENNYIEYVFDNNPNNNYKNAIVLKDYILIINGFILLSRIQV